MSIIGAENKAWAICRQNAKGNLSFEILGRGNIWHHLPAMQAFTINMTMMNTNMLINVLVRFSHEATLFLVCVENCSSVHNLYARLMLRSVLLASTVSKSFWKQPNEVLKDAVTASSGKQRITFVLKVEWRKAWTFLKWWIWSQSYFMLFVDLLNVQSLLLLLYSIVWWIIEKVVPQKYLFCARKCARWINCSKNKAAFLSCLLCKCLELFVLC